METEVFLQPATRVSKDTLEPGTGSGVTRRPQKELRHVWEKLDISATQVGLGGGGGEVSTPREGDVEVRRALSVVGVSPGGLEDLPWLRISP